jgi:putative methionine-R-sulfoxide reductase with GAF domain
MKLEVAGRSGSVENASQSPFFARERRRAARHAARIPAYASLNGSAQVISLELCQILNINESGTCIQAPAPMKVNRLLPLVLEFSDTTARIHTTGHVVWSDVSGKSGIRFPELPDISRAQLQQWLAVNDTHAGDERDVTHANPQPAPVSPPSHPHPNSAASYTSLITEWAEIEKEVELLGPNLDAALQFIGERALALTWATGAAVALFQDAGSTELICRARAGNNSPELGARLDSNEGISGECIRHAAALICHDAENDARVNSDSCRVAGIKSMVAAPIKARKGEVIGLIEVFSPEPAAFWDNDARTLERLARVTATAISRAKANEKKPSQESAAETKPAEPAPPPVFEADDAFSGGPTAMQKVAVLFVSGIAAVVIAVWLTAPWISEAMNKFIVPPKSQASETAPASFEYVNMGIEEVRKAALAGNPEAAYALGLKYASGDGAGVDYHEALSWFLKSADAGNVRATGKVASCFWAGRGAPQDYSKAYFWALLAQAAGDETGRVIVINSAPHLNDHQRVAEEQEADIWLRAHHLGSSPQAHR